MKCITTLKRRFLDPRLTCCLWQTSGKTNEVHLSLVSQVLPAVVNQVRWPCSPVGYTRMGLHFEATADMGMNCGSGSHSQCDLGQVSLTSLSL